MCIAGDDDRVSRGVDNTRVVAFVRPRHTDYTQRAGSPIHLIVTGFRLKCHHKTLVHDHCRMQELSRQTKQQNYQTYTAIPYAR